MSKSDIDADAFARPWHRDRPGSQQAAFNQSRSGQRILGERSDSPGDEKRELRDEAKYKGLPAGRWIAEQLLSDANGDWSWKPQRDKLLGDNFTTYKPTRHPLAGIRS